MPVFFLDRCLHFVNQILDVRRRRAANVHDEIGMLERKLVPRRSACLSGHTTRSAAPHDRPAGCGTPNLHSANQRLAGNAFVQ